MTFRWLNPMQTQAFMRAGMLQTLGVMVFGLLIDGACWTRDRLCEAGTLVACYSGPEGTEGVGICHAGAQDCSNLGLVDGACVGQQLPQIEVCDKEALDEDCDGEVNEEGADCKCGDGYLSTGEYCDDGSLDPADACPPTCQNQRVLQVTAGGYHACAVLNDGRLKCWGSHVYGELGLGFVGNLGDSPNEMGAYLPAVDLGRGNVAATIFADYFRTCALLTDGRIKCWGANWSGQLGLGDTDARGLAPDQMGDNLAAVDLGTSKTAVAIAGSNFHTCAVLSDGQVKCWGINWSGQLGLGDTLARGFAPDQMGDNLPAVDLGMGNVATAMAAGDSFTCALLGDGHIKCWGLNFGGQLGLGDDQTRGDGPDEMGDNLPVVDLGTGKTAIAIAAGDYHACAVLNDGSLKCWGVNWEGQLGLGDTMYRGTMPDEMGDNLPAVDLGTGKTAVAVAANTSRTCALLSDSSVKCWGSSVGSFPGQMGDNLPAVDLGSGQTALAISMNDSNICVLLNNRSVKCWGSNFYGQLGVGDILDRWLYPGQFNENHPIVRLFSDRW